jgi:hypothetical protein
LPFGDESLTQEQSQWLALLERGELPHRSISDGPGSLMVQPEWRDLLEKSAKRAGNSNWEMWYHLGVMRFRAGEAAGARDAWNKSLECEANAFARRDLAVLARDAGDDATAADEWLKAAQLAPDLAPLAIETSQALMRAGRYRQLIDFVASLPDRVRAAGRVRLLHAMASLELGDFVAVEKYFASDLDIANIREKETILSDLWFGWHERRISKERAVAITEDFRKMIRKEFPPPVKFDFRLNTQM